MEVRKLLVGMGLAALCAIGPLVSNGAHAAGFATFGSFAMVPSNAAVAACLPHAGAQVTVETQGINQVMVVNAFGLLPNTGYDLFVTNQATPPFGPSWYQSDLETSSSGSGAARVQGVFSHETFLLSQGQVTAGSGIVFSPTHTFNLGLWFNNPADPFNNGCEPGKTAPVVTPFNGEQDAGIQVLRTQVLNPSNPQVGPLAAF